MPKGRLCNPCIEKDGIWFPHIGVSRKLPMTGTQEMLYRASWRETRLPHLCTAGNKNQAQDGFPFSAHDNRNILQGAGEYLDSGLGRKKTPFERRQHSSRNFNLLCHDQPPRATSYYGLTSAQISYRGRQDTEKPFCRRYPNHHHERSTHMQNLPENHFMWFADYH
ncbi:testis-expressed protein 36 [Hyla sarda]|uniref:testis-expressed protein 36 n=1 Tax=Hyla sarda TaxID=327740 RepID=UPI0024C3363F|nr:testis-expressed protein 36 [Hyla sarda]XP_056388751.1 testis-expressed protein 36 [Hyla sarda]XP_056388753.1 testis-expressed protein 36 [Hyla sarda]